MARPTKQGLDYFPLDVDFFNDEKIEAVSGEFGIKGELIAIKLLCTIYRNGYFAMWNDLTKMKLCKAMTGVSPELIEQVVLRLVKWGFFNESLFNSEKVLTSSGIQKRFIEATKRRKDDPILVYVCNNSINVNINPTSSVVNDNISTQSKVKESKVKEKESKKATEVAIPQSSLKNTLGERKLEFGRELKPYVETYGSAMIRKFYDYWTEQNKSATKMKYELERTFEIPKRLATWAQRDNEWSKHNSTNNSNQPTNNATNQYDTTRYQG
jgi:Domain of unknown function (DUF4373)